MSSPTRRIKAQRGTGLCQRVGEILRKRGLTGIADVRGTDAAQQRHLLGRAHDVDQRDAVRRADLLQHVSEIRRRGGVHQPGVALHPHGLDHAQRREGIHETRGGVHRGGPVREDQAVRGGDAAVLRIHGAAPHADDFAEEGVRRVRRPCRHHDATPFIPAAMVRPMRPAAACIASGASVARTACAATRVSRTIVLISARANMTPKSDGLMGAASIRTTTSSGPGAGRSVSTRARVTVLS